MQRRFLFLLLIFSVFVVSLNCQTRSDEKAEECQYLTLAEAEKILGARVELVSNSWTYTTDANKFDCAYRAVEKDKASGKEINLFFRLEESTTEDQAKQIYESIWESNKNHAGIEPLSGIGDEAYAHSDKPNFHFVFARKGKFTLRMKVNKAVAATSPEALKAFAKRVVEGI